MTDKLVKNPKARLPKAGEKPADGDLAPKPVGAGDEHTWSGAGTWVVTSARFGEKTHIAVTSTSRDENGEVEVKQRFEVRHAAKMAAGMLSALFLADPHLSEQVVEAARNEAKRIASGLEVKGQALPKPKDNVVSLPPLIRGDG